MLGKKKTKKEIEKENDSIFVDNDKTDEPTPTVVVEAKEAVNNHTVTKAITGILSIALIALTGYALFARIYESGNAKNKENSYLILDGKSASETKEILSKFGKDKQRQAGDYGFIGNKMFISENKITPTTIANKDFFKGDSTYTDFGLYDVINNTRKDESTSLANGKCYIDLSKVSEGNYLVYPYNGNESIEGEANYNFYSLTQSDSVKNTFYSLPSSNGERTRITFQSNINSPYSLIRVKNAGDTLPSDYYDVVLFYKEYEGNTKLAIDDADISKLEYLARELSVNHNYKVKVVKSIQEAINTYATVSVAVTEADITTPYSSFYTYTDNIKTNSTFITSTFEDGQLKGYDSLPEIRETVSYLDCGSNSYSNIPGNDTVRRDGSHHGKEAFLAKDDIDSILNVLTNI